MSAGRHPAHPRRGELDGQRHMIEALADLDHRRLVAFGELEIGADHSGAVDEQFDTVARHAALDNGATAHTCSPRTPSGV